MFTHADVHISPTISQLIQPEFWLMFLWTFCARTHTHTHTQTYIYIYIYISSYPITDLDRPVRFQEVEAPGTSRHSGYEGVKFVSRTHRPPLSPLPLLVHRYTTCVTWVCVCDAKRNCSFVSLFNPNLFTTVFCSTIHLFSSFELALHNDLCVYVCVCVKKCYLLSSAFVQRKWVSRLFFFNLFLLFSCESEGHTVVNRQTIILWGAGGKHQCSNFHLQFPPSYYTQVASCCDVMGIKVPFQLPVVRKTTE